MATLSAIDEYLKNKKRAINSYQTNVKSKNYKYPTIDEDRYGLEEVATGGYAKLLRENPKLRAELEADRKAREASGEAYKVYDSFTNTGMHGAEGVRAGDLKIGYNESGQQVLTRPNGYREDLYKHPDGSISTSKESTKKSPITVTPAKSSSNDSTPISDFFSNYYKNRNYLDSNDVLNRIDGYGSYEYTPPERERPEMRSGESMANLLGINYNMDYMRGIYDDATKAKYANLDNEYEQAQANYYRSLAQNAAGVNDAILRGDRAAAMSGANRGVMTSDAATALLGLANSGATGATKIAQERAAQVTKRESELAQNAAKALADFNKLGLDLGSLSKEELAHLMQGYVSEMAHDATLGGEAMRAKAAVEAAKTNALSALYNSEAMERQALYSADKGLEGLVYQSDNQLKGTKAGITSNEAMAQKKIDADFKLQDLINKSNEAMNLAKTNAYKPSYSSGGYKSYGGYTGGSGSKGSTNPLAEQQAIMNALRGNPELARYLVGTGYLDPSYLDYILLNKDNPLGAVTTPTENEQKILDLKEQLENPSKTIQYFPKDVIENIMQGISSKGVTDKSKQPKGTTNPIFTPAVPGFGLIPWTK